MEGPKLGIRAAACAIALALTLPSQDPAQARGKKDQRPDWPAILSKGVFLKGDKPAKGALEGSVLVVNQWATWCGPCVGEIPELNELVERFGHQGVEFIAVTDQHPRTIIDFLRRAPFDFRYRQLANGRMALSRIRRSLHAAGHETGSAYPQHTVIGSDGSVVFHKVGYNRHVATSLAKAIEVSLEARAEAAAEASPSN